MSSFLTGPYLAIQDTWLHSTQQSQAGLQILFLPVLSEPYTGCPAWGRHHISWFTLFCT